MKKRSTIIYIILMFCIFAPVLFFLFRDEERAYAVTGERKSAVILMDGFPTVHEDGTWGTVGDFLADEGGDIREEDDIFPSRETPLSSGMNVMVLRSKMVRMMVDGEDREIRTFGRTVGEALRDAGVTLREDDLVMPDTSTLLGREEEIRVIRVEIREEAVEKPIAFATIEKEDDGLSWRKRLVETKGENGIREYRYRVGYHDGVEVARKPLGDEVTKEAVDEVVVQGTLVKTGKAHSGLGTWYIHTGTLAAASLWLPMGSYAKVTNRANGRSVIVRINDRGPFGTDRIIDLDKVAFREIASLGAGVIDVKVEEIVN